MTDGVLLKLTPPLQAFQMLAQAPRAFETTAHKLDGSCLFEAVLST